MENNLHLDISLMYGRDGINGKENVKYGEYHVKHHPYTTSRRTDNCDGTAAANLAYKPAFVSNNPKEGKKVISVIEDELMKCELKCIPANLRLICGWRRKFL